MTDILLRMPDVQKRTGLGRSALYLLIKTGKFPAPVELGKRARGWNSNLVDEWIAGRPKAKAHRCCVKKEGGRIV